MKEFLQATDGTSVGGYDLKAGDIIMVADLPAGLIEALNPRAFDELDAEDAHALIDSGEFALVRMNHGEAAEEIEMLAEDEPALTNFDDLLSGNIREVAAAVEEIEDIMFLGELRDAEEMTKNRKGVIAAIDDRMATMKDPTPEENPVHVIDDTRVGIEETEL